MTDLDFVLAGIDARDNDHAKLTGDRWGRSDKAQPLSKVDIKRKKDRLAATRRHATRLGIDWRALDGGAG